MNKFLLFTILVFTGMQSKAQWVTPNQLTDLNTWSSQSGFIGWYDTPANTPLGQTYGSGIQIALSQDSRFGSQIVLPTFDNQIYYRRNQAGAWDSWFKVWSSSNLNNADVDFTCKNLFSNGNLWAKEIKVASTNPWPDYVFKPDYRLPSLTELKTYIDQHSHLPDMPSASQVAKEGIDLGDMNAKLLKKVEELTLYLIQKDSELKNEKSRNDAQQTELLVQKKAIQQLLLKLEDLEKKL